VIYIKPPFASVKGKVVGSEINQILYTGHHLPGGARFPADIGLGVGDHRQQESILRVSGFFFLEYFLGRVEGVGERGFARAVGAQEPEDLPGGNLRIQGRPFPVMFAQVMGDNHDNLGHRSRCDPRDNISTSKP